MTSKYPSFRCRVLKWHNYKLVNTHTLKDEYAEIVFEVLKCRRCGALNLSQWTELVDAKKLFDLTKGA